MSRRKTIRESRENENRATNQGGRGRHNMTDELKKEMIDTFHLLDDIHEGAMPATKLIVAQRIFGFEPTAAAMERSKGPKVDLNEYMSFMISCCSTQQQWCAAEIDETFQLYDREHVGFITNAQFKRTLGRIGEKLTEVEIEQQMKEMETQNGNVELSGFTNLILAIEK